MFNTKNLSISVNACVHLYRSNPEQQKDGWAGLTALPQKSLKIINLEAVFICCFNMKTYRLNIFSIEKLSKYPLKTMDSEVQSQQACRY